MTVGTEDAGTTEVNTEEPKITEVETSDQPDKEDTGLRIGIGTDETTGNIVVAFGKPVPWIAFRPDEALKFGEMVMAKAQERIVAMQNDAKAALEPKAEVTETLVEPVVDTQAPVLNEGATLSEEPVETPVEPKVDDTTDADGQLNPPEAGDIVTDVEQENPPKPEPVEEVADTAPVEKPE